jgi:uncharacterized protein (DUF1501 family)
VGLEIAFADCGGWDTRESGLERGTLSARLRELGLALSAFSRDLGERMRSVVVLTMSEFGRTIRENGNSGTDHGHATAMLVMGGPVTGGQVLGRWPGLDSDKRFEGRDVAITTDFRDLFGEILVRHLGASDLAPCSQATCHPPRFRGRSKQASPPATAFSRITPSPALSRIVSQSVRTRSHS